MNATETNLPVIMARGDLNDLPEVAIPLGFSIRWYQKGDEAHWMRIHLAADIFNRITPELFRDQFGSEEELLHERQCYLLASSGEVTGTGTAWFNNDFAGGRWGRVHWMAIVPEWQRRGLGKAMLAAICGRLRELGHERAYLTTSTARGAAISLYLPFGFAPVTQNQEEERLWRQLIPLAKR